MAALNPLNNPNNDQKINQDVPNFGAKSSIAENLFKALNSLVDKATDKRVINNNTEFEQLSNRLMLEDLLKQIAKMNKELHGIVKAKRLRNRKKINTLANSLEANLPNPKNGPANRNSHTGSRPSPSASNISAQAHVSSSASSSSSSTRPQASSSRSNAVERKRSTAEATVAEQGRSNQQPAILTERTTARLVADRADSKENAMDSIPGPATSIFQAEDDYGTQASSPLRASTLPHFARSQNLWSRNTSRRREDEQQHARSRSRSLSPSGSEYDSDGSSG